MSDAEASYRHALAIDPDWHVAHNNLGSALMDLGRLGEAENCFRTALRLAPDFAVAHSNLLFLLNYDPDRSAEQIFSEYRNFNDKFGLPLRSQWRPHCNERNPLRRLKVGYVSPDFRKHSARHFVEPLLANHDRSALELYAYAEVEKEDEVSVRIKALVRPLDSDWGDE